MLSRETQDLARRIIVERRKADPRTDMENAFTWFTVQHETVDISLAAFRQVWRSVVEDGQEVAKPDEIPACEPKPADAPAA